MYYQYADLGAQEPGDEGEEGFSRSLLPRQMAGGQRFEMRFNRYLREPDFLEVRVANPSLAQADHERADVALSQVDQELIPLSQQETTQNAAENPHGGFLASSTTLVPENVPESAALVTIENQQYSRFRSLIPSRSKNLLFDEAEHVYTLKDVKDLDIDQRPDYLSMISYSGMSHWLFADFQENENRDRNMEASVDHMLQRGYLVSSLFFDSYPTSFYLIQSFADSFVVWSIIFPQRSRFSNVVSKAKRRGHSNT